MREAKLQKGFTIDGKMVTPMVIMDYFWSIFDQADRYFKKTIDPDWQRNEDLYRDKFSVPRKMQWQSEVQLPIVDQLITRITQFFTRTLVNTFERFFNVKHDDKEKQTAYTEILKAILRDNKFAEHVFPEALANSWLNALFVTKTYWHTERDTYPLWNEETNQLEYDEEIKSRVKIEVIKPRNIRLDPYGDQYIIEICPNIPLHTFMEMGEQNGWINMEAIKRDLLFDAPSGIDDDATDPEEKSKHLPLINLHYVYTKALTDESGDLICKDVCFVIVNKDYVVDFKYNTGVNGATPYTVHNPMLDVYGRYGRPYISKVRSLIKEFVKTVNLAVDAGVLSGLGTHELRRDLLDTGMTHTVTSDIDPGRTLSKRGEGKLLESTYPPTGVVQSLLQLVYFFDQQIQNHSYQTEFFDGQNTSRGRKTATEVQTKVQQSNTFFTDIATQIENHSVQPTLEKALYTYLLNMDDDTIKDLSVNISDEKVRGYFIGLSYADRLKDIRDLQVEVKGISGRLQVQNNFSKVLQLLSILANFGAVQGIAVTKLIEKGFEVVDDTPDEFFDMELLQQVTQGMSQAPSTQQQPSGVSGQVAGGMDQPPGAQVQRSIADQSAGV